MEESEKATSCQKLNPGHLACAATIQAWYKPAVLGSNHGDCRPYSLSSTLPQSITKYLIST